MPKTTYVNDAIKEVFGKVNKEKGMKEMKDLYSSISNTISYWKTSHLKTTNKDIRGKLIILCMVLNYYTL